MWIPDIRGYNFYEFEVIMCEAKVYVLKQSDIVKKIAQYEKSGEYGVARGLLIAASLAGMPVSTFKFYNATSDVKKTSRSKV